MNNSYTKGKEDGLRSKWKNFYNLIGEKENLTSEILKNKIDMSYSKRF
jgi:hypothetical protein